MNFHSKQKAFGFLKGLLTFCLILYTFNAFPQQEDEHKNSFTVYENLSFSVSDPQLTLDLFLPNEIPGLIPCIVVIQGGGFFSQDGQRFRYFAEYIANGNYAAALISYRGKPDYMYPTTIDDIKSAVRFIRSNSSKYSINPDKIGAMGRSAGGTLAALLTVSEDNSFGKEQQKISGKVQAAVAYAGVFDFISRFADSSQVALQPNVDTKIESNTEWIGPAYAQGNKHWKIASPINHLDKNDPPMLFMHCKDDQTVPWLQSQEMYENMISLDIRSEIKYFNQGGHGFRLGDNNQYLSPMMSFFKNQFE